MKSEQWFRGSAWDDAAQAEFEEKLLRARTRNQPQYLRIKALALEAAGLLDASRTLLLRIVEEFPDSLDYPFALELLGDLARAMGAKEEAETFYRRLLSERPDLNATSGMVEVSLAELLTERGTEATCTEALSLLDSARGRSSLRLNVQLFRWHLALADVAAAMGDAQTRQVACQTALVLTERGPQFPRHPTVGVVEPSSDLLHWLRLAAGGDDPGVRPRN